MDFDTVRRVAEKFLLRNYRNVRAVVIIDMRYAIFERESVYKAVGVATLSLDSIAASPTQVRVEVIVAKDGRIMAVQEQSLNDYRRDRKVLRPRRKR